VISSFEESNIYQGPAAYNTQFEKLRKSAAFDE
jgi:hypothetical protein